MTAGDHLDDPLEYLYEELPPEKMAEAKGHLAECPDCRAETRDIKEIVKAYRRAERPRPPTGLAARAAASALREAGRKDAAPAAGDPPTAIPNPIEARFEREFAHLKDEVMSEVGGKRRSWLLHPAWMAAASVIIVCTVLIHHSPRLNRQPESRVYTAQPRREARKDVATEPLPETMSREDLERVTVDAPPALSEAEAAAERLPMAESATASAPEPIAPAEEDGAASPDAPRPAPSGRSQTTGRPLSESIGSVAGPPASAPPVLNAAPLPEPNHPGATLQPPAPSDRDGGLPPSAAPATADSASTGGPSRKRAAPAASLRPPPAAAAMPTVAAQDEGGTATPPALDALMSGQNSDMRGDGYSMTTEPTASPSGAAGSGKADHDAAVMKAERPQPPPAPVPAASAARPDLPPEESPSFAPTFDNAQDAPEAAVPAQPPASAPPLQSATPPETTDAVTVEVLDFDWSQPPEIAPRPTPIDRRERILSLTSLAGMLIADREFAEAWKTVDMLRAYDPDAAEQVAEQIRQAEKAAPPSSSPARNEAAASEPAAVMEVVEPPEDPPLTEVLVPASLAPPGWTAPEAAAAPIAEEPSFAAGGAAAILGEASQPLAEPAITPVPAPPASPTPPPFAPVRTPPPASEPATDAQDEDEPGEEGEKGEQEGAPKSKWLRGSKRPASSSLWDSTVGRDVRPLVSPGERRNAAGKNGKRPFSTDPYVRGD